MTKSKIKFFRRHNFVLLQARMKNMEKKRLQRAKYNVFQKETERKKAKERMKKCRYKKTEEQKIQERKFNKERRYVIRKSKRGFRFDSNIDTLQQNFSIYQSTLHWRTCELCRQKILVDVYSKKKCHKCSTFRKGSELNPGTVPDCLKKLTFIERQLIARIHPVVSLYKIQNCQYGYKGNVINFPQNVQEIADILPHKIEDLNNIITIRIDTSNSHCDFNVRRNEVREALLWLKQNNHFYKDIEISESNLRLLPESCNMYQSMRGYNTMEEDTDCFKSECSSSTDDSDIEDIFSEKIEEDDFGIVFTDIPNTTDFSQKQQISNSLEGTVHPYPTIGKIPINEFESPGYFTNAFPTLFPYGLGDYTTLDSQRTVKMADYVKYLMNFEDGRFAKDERFRYFIMNTLMRWNALNCGNIFVKKNEIFSKMTLSQLKEHMQKHPNVAKKIMFYGSRIRSTRPYWGSRCAELLDMVNTIGPPTVFFTLSSADYHWPDVYRLLGVTDPNNLTISEKRKLISENPLLFDQFFLMRSEFFIEHCFTKKFKVKDIWYRYEYQHRGSIHLHGVAWFTDAPELKDIRNNEVQKEILKYFDELISCQNPDINCQINTIHPCAKRLSEITNIDNDMAELINRVQRHTKCSEKSCKSRNGKKLKTCRYKFPFELTESSKLIIEDEEIVEIVFKRNDQLMNKMNPWVLQTWRANIDFSPICSEASIYHYIAKYASKCEVKSSEYSEILKDITSAGLNDNESCKKSIRKLLISACAERDYCAQEVMHFIMGFPFYRCSRDFVILNMNHFSWSAVDTKGESKTLIHYYSSRPQVMDDMSLYEFCKSVRIRKGIFQKRKKEAIIRIFPKIAKKSNNSFHMEDIDRIYCFFFPWRSLSDFDIEKDIKIQKITVKEDMINMYLFKKTLDALKANHSNENMDNSPSHDFKKVIDPISSLMPNRKEHPIKIGQRPMDLNFEWGKWDYVFDSEVLHDLYEKIKEPIRNPVVFNIENTKLNTSQKKVLKQLKRQVKSIIEKTKKEGSITIVQGSAGTGKTLLLKHMFNFVINLLGVEAICLLAPTGTAAKLINGSTIHSYLKLGRRFSNITPLVGDELLKFQENKENIEFVFIDEYSMIGARLLAAMESRLRQMKDIEQPFGNLFIYLIGDCHQLVPCGDSPLFRSLKEESKGNGLLERGKLLINSVTHVHFLTKNYRANSNNYCDFLTQVSMGNCSKYDVRKINERCISVLCKKEINLFSKALKMCATNEIVDEFNMQKIIDLQKPIACIHSQNNNKKAFSSTTEKADGLVNTLYVCEGATVMLKRNINVSRGLVNGSIGTIFKILYENDEGPPNIPSYVLIEFQNVNLQGIGIQHVPIKPILATWTEKGTVCSRIQLPLVLAWACTIHKGQGIGIDRMILDMGETEFCIGLIYTALSRVSSFSSLVLIRRLTIERLNAVKKSKGYLDLVKFLDWLNTKVSL